MEEEREPYDPEVDPRKIRPWEDPDLFELVIQTYEDLGLVDDFDRRGSRPERLRSVRDAPLAEKRRVISSFFQRDKRPRREYAVRAGQFLTERKAARTAESSRLRSGAGRNRRGRAAALLQGASTLSSPSQDRANLGRAAATIGSLGQRGVLG
ncbi:MAG: hypothetical protein NXI30_04470 [bacterium]|nr:hypothetical protein [bacterium]